MLRATGILSTSAPINGVIVNPNGVQIPEHVPILDSHNVRNGCLGFLAGTSVEKDDDDAPALMGELVFTGVRGRRVFGLIERGAISGAVSCRFQTVHFEILDANGNELSAEEAVERGHDDPDLIVIAQRSILTEVSITATPADPGARVRCLGLRAQMWAAIRHGEAELRRILDRDTGDDADTGDMYQRFLADQRLVKYGAPEPILR
jgi:hypothetical protein